METNTQTKKKKGRGRPAGSKNIKRTLDKQSIVKPIENLKNSKNHLETSMRMYQFITVDSGLHDGIYTINEMLDVLSINGNIDELLDLRFNKETQEGETMHFTDHNNPNIKGVIKRLSNNVLD